MYTADYYRVDNGPRSHNTHTHAHIYSFQQTSYDIIYAKIDK